jgi:AGZA family xanthine/uracil permease-like MFS transporter
VLRARTDAGSGEPPSPWCHLAWILSTAVVGILRGITSWPGAIFGLPRPSSTLLKLDFRSASHLGLLDVVFAFLFVDLFDNVGTLVGVCEQAGFMRDGKIPGVGRVCWRMLWGQLSDL